MRSRVRSSAACLLFLVAVALATCIPACALDPAKAFSQYIQTSWNSEDGLPQKTVNAVEQTADGFLWLGTEEGLIRYDGQTFLTFDERNAPGLGDRMIRSLAPTPDGGMWIGTMTGLVRYDHGRFVSFREQTQFDSDIYDLGLTGDGSVWFSSDSGLRRYKRTGTDAGLHTYTMRDGLPSDSITGLARSADGSSLWVGTRRGLSHYAEGHFITYPCLRCRAGNDVVSVAPGHDGSVWAGMSDGSLALWKNGHLQPAWTGSMTHGASVLNMREDRDGTLWIAFRKLGLGRLRDGRLEILTRANGLPSINPDWVFEDRESNLWVGWADAGLSMFRDGRFTIFGKSEGLPSDTPSSVIQANDGNLWVGSEDAGVSHLRTSSFVLSHPSHQALNVSAVLAASETKGTGVMSLLQQTDGTLWVGSDRGSVTRIVHGHATVFKVPGPLTPGLPAMVEDGQGEPWFGFDMPNGLARLHDGHLEFQHLPGTIKAMARAPDGSLWIASYRSGIIHYADGVIRIYTQADGLSSLFLTSVYVDAQGTVWAGTQLGGLNRIEGGRITHISVEQGLSDSTVGEIVADGQGFLWLAGTRGIMRVAMKDLNAYAGGVAIRVSTRTFGYADGLRSDECNFKSHPAALRDASGRLWFTTLSGLAMIDPRHIRVNPIAPQPQIEGLFVGGAALEAGRSGFRVKPSHANLTVHFAAPTFVDPEHMQLRYRLVGLDNHWLQGVARQGVTFSNLAPGKYRFELKAANSDGVSGEAAATLSFEVLAHYYETWWFRLLALLGCSLLVYLGVKVRTRVLVRRTAQLEQLILEKTGEVRAALAAAEAARETIREQAMRDSLTGLWNRRAIFEILESEILRSERDNKPLAIIMVDIDHFKNVNDTWGHQAGDEVIREISQRLRDGIRKQDAVGRYGGEELLILLPNATLDEGVARAEALRESICKQPVSIGRFSIQVSCSFGLAHIESGVSCSCLVGQADAALYQAKRDGRNCVRLLESQVQ